MSISEVWLRQLEKTYRGTQGNLSNQATIRDLLVEIRRLQKKVRSQRTKLKSFDEMPKGADTPVRW